MIPLFTNFNFSEVLLEINVSIDRDRCVCILPNAAFVFWAITFFTE